MSLYDLVFLLPPLFLALMVAGALGTQGWVVEDGGEQDA